MPNTFATTTWVVNESAMRYMNSVKFVANIDRTYDAQFKTHDGAKVGNTVFARLPILPTVRSGQGWSPQAITDRTVPVTLTYQKGSDLDWSSIQATTELDRARERYINPCADALASTCDMDAMQDIYKSIYQNMGTPGTTPTANTTWMTAAAKIFDSSGPSEDLVAVLDVASQIALVNANFTIFNPQGKISENYNKGRFAGPALGIDDWFTDQSMPKHTTGTFTSSTPVVDTASQTGSTITSNGWASNVTSLKAGDTLEFANVFSVNPLTKQSTGRLQQFVLTADCADSGGTLSLLISPPIVTSGPLQNVSNAPALNTPVYMFNTRSTTYAQTTTVSPQNLVYHRKGAAFVMADLADPIAGAKASFARSEDYGLNIRLVQQYLLAGDQNGTRLDAVYGASIIQARLMSRVYA